MLFELFLIGFAIWFVANWVAAVVIAFMNPTDRY